MKGKILLVAGLGVGYVLGARAGREKFDQLKASFDKFWNDPRVQKQVQTAEGYVKDKAPEVAGFVSDQTKKVAAQVGSKSKNGESKAASAD